MHDSPPAPRGTWTVHRTPASGFRRPRDAEASRDPVHDGREQHDRQSRLKAEADVEARDAREHVVAQTTRSDHGRDDYHRKCNHDGRVDAGHDGRQPPGNLHLEQQLPRRAAEGDTRLDLLAVDLADSEARQSHHRPHRKDHRRQHAQHLVQTDQHRGGNQVHKCRHRLHEVEAQTHDRCREIALGGPDAERLVGDGPEALLSQVLLEYERLE